MTNRLDIIQAIEFFGTLTKEELLEKVKMRYYSNGKAFREDEFDAALQSVLNTREIKCNKEENGDHLNWYSTTKYYC